MALPGITAPPGTPVFLAEGHGIAEDSLYAPVKFATGHSRSRRIQTASERIVSVNWFLDPAQMAAVDLWYENDLLVGSREFAAQVADQFGWRLAWWTARWVDFQIELLAFGRGRLSGQLFLTGEPSQTPPDTSSLASESLIDLLGIPGSVAGNVALASEAVIALTQPVSLASEALIALTQPPPPEERVTEDGEERVTEDDETRILE